MALVLRFSVVLLMETIYLPSNLCYLIIINEYDFSHHGSRHMDRESKPDYLTDCEMSEYRR